MLSKIPSDLLPSVLEKMNALSFTTMYCTSTSLKNYIEAHKKPIRKVHIRVKFSVCFFFPEQIVIALLPISNGFVGHIEANITKENFQQKLKKFIAANNLFRFNFAEIDISIDELTPLVKIFLSTCKRGRVTGKEVITQIWSIIDEAKDVFSPISVTFDALYKSPEYFSQLERIKLINIGDEDWSKIFKSLAPVAKSLTIERVDFDSWRIYKLVAELFFELVKNQAKIPEATNEVFFSFSQMPKESFSKMEALLGDVNFYYYEEINNLHLNVAFLETSQKKTFTVVFENHNCVEGIISYSFKTVGSIDQFYSFYKDSFKFHENAGDPSYIFCRTLEEELMDNETIIDILRKFY